MEINVVQGDKHTVTIALDNATVAEILRVYLVEAGADFAAWRREHPSKPVQLRITSEKGVAKVVSSAVSAITKDCEALRSTVKK